MGNIGGMINSLRPGRNGRHFENDIFQNIFSHTFFQISHKISFKCVTHG